MIIDAKDKLLGRLGTVVAKQALLGNIVDVINCEECVVSGRIPATLEIYHRKMHRNAPHKGPFFFRRPDMMVRRTIRGMLPWKRSRGREAYKNVRCHIGVPDALKNQKVHEVNIDDHSKLKAADYVKIKEICRSVGGKI